MHRILGTQNKMNIIFDFDSTLVSVESFDLAAELALKETGKDLEKTLSKITEITNSGMNGEITLLESIAKRMEIAGVNENYLKKTGEICTTKLASGIEALIKKLQKQNVNIYIVSGGHDECIYPVSDKLGIPRENVKTNIIKLKNGKLDPDGSFIKSRKLSIVKNLNLDPNKTVTVGDGWTDLEIWKNGLTKHLVAYAEFAKRKKVLRSADKIAHNVNELESYLNEIADEITATNSSPKKPIKTILSHTNMKGLKNEKVLFLENVNQAAVDMFKKAGFKDVEVLSSAIPEEELMKRIKDVAVLGVRSRTWLKKDLFKKAKKLVAVGCFIVGVNKVDMEAAEKAGAPVFHGPFSSTRSVAELAMGFVFSLFRKVHEKNLGAHESKWLKKVDGQEVRGKTIGIIGFSNIGSQVGMMAEALGMNVIYYDVANVLPLGNAKRMKTVDSLLKKADVVSIHVPSLPSTRGMINKDSLAKMKDGALLINTSRGDILNEEDVCAALESGQLGGLATDVYTTEPKSPKDPLESPYVKYPNALLTPHIGGSTAEAQSGIGAEVAGKLLDFLQTGKTADAINFPRLMLPPHEKTHRVLHIHKNVPGMLAAINDAFASQKINISGQYLETTKHIGYCVTDIDGECSDDVFDQLKGIEGTVKCHVLS